MRKLLPFFVGIVVTAIGFLNLLSFPSIARAATKTWTTQAEWQAGTTSNIDSTSTAGSIKLSSSGGGGTIAFRAASHSGGQGQSANKPTGVVDNDVMIAVVTVFADLGDVTTLTITPPAGWNLIRRMNHAGENMGMATYYKVAASEGASYTWTLSSGSSLVGIMAYSGVDTADPIDVENASTDLNGNPPGFGLSHVTPSVTTTVANTRIVTAFVHGDGRGVFSPPAGETERFETAYGNTGSDIASAGNDEAQAAIGATGTKTTSMSGIASGGISQILALAPGSGTTYNTPGTDTLQYDSGTSGTTWSALSWTGSTPTNTAIKTRARAAETQGGLSSASWSGYITTSGGSIDLTGRYAEVEWHLSTTDTSVTPTLNDGTITYSIATSGPTPTPTPTPTSTSATTPAPTPTPTVIQVTACSTAFKNLTVATTHVTADFAFTTTTTTRATLYYYESSRTSPLDAPNKVARNYDLGSTKVEGVTTTKDHKITLLNISPNKKYYYTLALSSGSVECEHNFTTQTPPPTPTPASKPTPTPNPTTKPVPVTSTVSGYVYEQGTTKPIPNVTMYLYKRWLFGWRDVARVNTDANGYWQIKYEKGQDYRVRTYLNNKLANSSVPRTGLEFAKPGEACPASETNTQFLTWNGDKRLTETPCENNIFYASFVAQAGGTVIDPVTQKPAPGIVIGLRRKEFFGLFWRTTAFTTTDAEGKWRFAYMTGLEYQTYISVQDSSAIFPQGRREPDGSQSLASYKANGKVATPGCSSTKQDERSISWESSNRLTADGCLNNVFYVDPRVDFKVQVLVDKANAPLPGVKLRLLGKLNGIWRGSQDGKKTDANGLVTYSYFPGSTFRIYTYNGYPGYVQGYTQAFPGCPAKTVTTTSRVNLVEWSDDKQLPAGGCATPTRMYMTSLENVTLGIAINPPGGTFQDKVEISLSHTPANHIGSHRMNQIDKTAKNPNPNTTNIVTVKSGVYRKPFTIFKSRVINHKFFGSESPQNSAEFIITKASPPPTPTPTPGGTPNPTPSPSPDPNAITVTATPLGGEYEQPTKVSLTPSDRTAKILYSTDGTDPTVGGREYKGPITLSASTLLHFYAQKDATQSEMGEESYSFKNSENPVIIGWEDDTPNPPPYIVTCNSKEVGTTTQTTFTDTNLQLDGCVYKIKSGDKEITPTKIVFAPLAEGSKSKLPLLTDIATATATALAAVPLSQVAVRIPDFLMYGWFGLLMLLGLRRKGTSWARVVSSTTGKGIFGVHIAFVNTARYNRVVGRTFTDRDGKFYLPTTAGTYSLRITHANYVFPSQVTQDGYHGEEIHIIENSTLSLEIPLDESNGGSALMQRLKALTFRLASLNSLTLALGTILIGYSLYKGVTLLNGILGLYYLMFIISEVRRWKLGRNTVTVKNSAGKPVGLAVVRLESKAGKIVYTRATDAFGRALIDAPQGDYTLHVAATDQGEAEQTVTITKNPFRHAIVIRLK